MDTVALVNGTPITAADFKKRFELTVYPHKENRAGLEYEKERFLYSLIAERLLADVAARSGKALTPRATQLGKEATATFLRDALYRKLIMSQVHVTQTEIARGVDRAAYTYSIAVYLFPDSVSAVEFYRQYHQLKPRQLDSALSASRMPVDTMAVKYGDLLQKEEDAFWGHEPGFLSRPLDGGGKFAVLRILKKAYDVAFSNLSQEAKENEIRKQIRTREEVAATESYVNKTFGDISVNVRKDLFKELVDSVSFLLKNQMPSQFQLYYNLTEPEIDTLLQMFAEQDSLPMITFNQADDNGHEQIRTLRDVIVGLIPSTFYCKDPSPPAVFAGLNITLRHFVEFDLLAERARTLGLEHSREVRENVGLIMNAYLAGETREAVMDTVRLNQSDIDAFLQRYNSSELRKIFLTVLSCKARSLDDAADCYRELDRPPDSVKDRFATVLAQVQLDTMKSNAFVLGTIGAFFTQSELGQTYGPVRNDDGSYSIYKLLSRRTDIPDSSFSLSTDTTKMIALEIKQEQALSKFVAALASKGDVKIFLEVLKKVHVEPLQMFTVRKIGFGGQINAVPGLAVCEDWTKFVPMQEIVIP